MLEMRYFLTIIFIFSLLFFAAEPPKSKPTRKVNPLKGIASFYHQKFVGRKTSSGEIFSNKKRTAAHKTLPLGTLVKITNIDNDSTVVVKINDRLPKNSKRTIDLSRVAAEQLNFIKKGLTPVAIEIISCPGNNIMH
jgi:rare lipoprotein A